MIKKGQLRYLVISICLFMGGDIFAQSSREIGSDEIGSDEGGYVWMAIAIALAIIAITLSVLSLYFSQKRNQRENDNDSVPSQRESQLKNNISMLRKDYDQLIKDIIELRSKMDRLAESSNQAIQQPGLSERNIEAQIILALDDYMKNDKNLWSLLELIKCSGLFQQEVQREENIKEEYVLCSAVEHQTKRQTQDQYDEFAVNAPSFFAGSVDESTGVFYRTTPSLDVDKTVVEFVSLDNIRAVFRVHKNAKSRILQDQSFIEGSCEVQEVCSNPHIVETIENGIAEKQVDGKWKVITKAKVRLS